MPGVEKLSTSAEESFANDSNLLYENKICRLATIDIGTNSTHLLIASIDRSLKTFNIELAEKSTTRLGERETDSGCLTSLAMNRVYQTLKRFKDISLSYKVTDLVIAATSAVREAPNGRDFLAQIKEQLELDVDLISGQEEARLIYLGVLSGMKFGNQPHFVLDIGGGSTELVLADSHDARALTSTKIGAVRLQSEFIKEESLSPEKHELLKTVIKGSLESAVNKVLDRVRAGENPIMVATSGTALSLASLIASKEGHSQNKLQGYGLKKSSLDILVNELVAMTPEERLDLPLLSERRAEIIVPGALILQTTMQMLGVGEVLLSERALREGLVVDWMFRHNLLEDRFSLQASIREKTVLHQAQRFSVDKERSERVAKIALILYESTKGFLHQDIGEGRDLLWAAAMLHSCGKHINLNAYHKHSWYLIRNGELLGYSQSEHLMVASIARYHRKSFPRKRHEAWQVLENATQRQIVSEMALLLRLAVSIGKRPEPVISSINVQSKANALEIELIPEKLGQNIDLEKWSLNRTIANIKKNQDIDINVI